MVLLEHALKHVVDGRGKPAFGRCRDVFRGTKENVVQHLPRGGSTDSCNLMAAAALLAACDATATLLSLLPSDSCCVLASSALLLLSVLFMLFMSLQLTSLLSLLLSLLFKLLLMIARETEKGKEELAPCRGEKGPRRSSALLGSALVGSNLNFISYCRCFPPL